MYGREKVKKVYGKFVSEKDATVLKKAQKLRLIFTHCSALTLAVMLFLPQEWAEKSKDIVWLQTAYVLLVFALVVVSVIAAFSAGKSCNLTKEISEKYKPRSGFEKATFASAEWLMYAHVLLVAVQIALLIYGFGLWGLFAVLLSCGGAALAVMARIVCFRALKDDLKYIPPETETADKAENADKAAASDSAET